MIHHAYRDLHTAHDDRLACDRYGCKWPTLPEGEDGKCDWCRQADKNLADLMARLGGAI